LIVPIPPDDPYLDRECIVRKGSVRATACDDIVNSSLPAEQVNQISAFVDAGSIYGLNDDLLNDLKNEESGTSVCSFVRFM